MKLTLSAVFISTALSASVFTPSTSADEAILAGGCFWCMESDFEKLDGVTDVVSGFTGGSAPNPTYNGNHKGHFEAVKITYDGDMLSYNDILDHFWVNIDPFDDRGQFCDKGYSYRSVAFFKNDEQRKLINKSKRKIEQKFNKKVVTYVIKFDKFYEAENYHQDYYRKKFLNYLRYKKACGREKILDKIVEGKLQPIY